MSYTPLTEEEVYQHFIAVAEAGELPLCIYNNPSTTHFTFSEGLLARLAQVANIAAVKMPLPANSDFAGELTRFVRPCRKASQSATVAIGARPMPCWRALMLGTA